MPELTTQTSSIVSKVWGLCNPLRDDGVSYGDYLEQLTYLIFLKMADEYSKPPYNRDSGIPEGCSWQDMRNLKGTELEEKYKRCKPFRITFYEFPDSYGVKCPYITVRPDTDTDKIVLCLRSDYVRNVILEYRRP